MRLTAVLTALAALAAATARDAVLQDAQQAAINLNILDYRQVQDGLRLWEQSATGSLLDEVRTNRVTYAHVITDTKTATTAASASSRRRPRVAGRQHPGRSVTVALEEPPPSAVEVPVGEELSGHSRWRTAVRVALIAVVLAALGMAAWLHGETDALLGSAATSNRALLDPGPTRRGVRAGPGCGGTCVLLRLRPDRRQRMRRRRDHRPFASTTIAQQFDEWPISALIGRADRKMAADRAYPTTDRTMNS